MQCARCYQQNRQGRRFCSECGVLAGTCLPILRLLEWGTFGYPQSPTAQHVAGVLHPGDLTEKILTLEKRP